MRDQTIKASSGDFVVREIAPASLCASIHQRHCSSGPDGSPSYPLIADLEDGDAPDQAPELLLQGHETIRSFDGQVH